MFVDCKFIFLASIQDKELEKLCKKARKPKYNLKDKPYNFLNTDPIAVKLRLNAFYVHWS